MSPSRPSTRISCSRGCSGHQRNRDAEGSRPQARDLAPGHAGFPANPPDPSGGTGESRAAVGGHVPLGRAGASMAGTTPQGERAAEVRHPHGRHPRRPLAGARPYHAGEDLVTEREPFALAGDRFCPKCLAGDPTVTYRTAGDRTAWIMGLQEEWLELTCRCGYVWAIEVHVPAGRKVGA